MAVGVQRWSKTAAANATADTNINWAEGMSPSAVNDSARAEMASVAKWRDDISGTLTTGGTSTAYTLATNQLFTADAAGMSGAQLCFIPHATSGAAPTLAVDGLTARAINKSTGVAVATGQLIAGTPYRVTYIHASTEFILMGYTEVFANVTITGTLGVTSNLTVNTNKVTITAASGNIDSAGVLTMANGTVSLPAHSFTNDTDCGAYRIGANNIGYAVNGAKVLDIATTGLTVTGDLRASAPTIPSVQRLTSGTAATFTPTAGAVKWRIRMCGSGSGGCASNLATAPTAGGTTSFQVNSTGTAWTCGGGTAGGGVNPGAGGSGGTDGTTGTKIDRRNGGTGHGGLNTSVANVNPPGGAGGTNPFGGAGSGAPTGTTGGTAVANSGAGGGGGGAGSGHNSGGGGGSGEWAEFWVTGMTTGTYTIGAGGAGTPIGAGDKAGGAGADGIIIIEEFFS